MSEKDELESELHQMVEQVDDELERHMAIIKQYEKDRAILFRILIISVATFFIAVIFLWLRH